MKRHEHYLRIALLLTSIFAVIEVTGGWLLGSLALISDAAHMLTDVAALVISLFAIQIAKRKSDTKRTFGYYRFEILAAVINAVTLIILSVYIFYQAYKRLFVPHEVHTTGMLIIAVGGLMINITAIRLLYAGSQQSLNVRGAYLDAWADMLGSIGVIIAAVIIKITHWHMVDSIMAILIGVWILPRSWTLLKESINILLEGVPEGLELSEINRTLSKIHGVIDVHDLHVWALTSGKISLTAHLVIDPKIKDEQKVLKMATEEMEEKYNITHSTIQVEIEPCVHGMPGSPGHLHH